MTVPPGLLELAENATPGPWHANVNDLIGGMLVSNGTRPASEIWQEEPSDVVVADLFWRDADAAYVAAANPQTILALLAERNLLRTVAEELIYMLDGAGMKALARKYRKTLGEQQDGGR